MRIFEMWRINFRSGQNAQLTAGISQKRPANHQATQDTDVSQATQAAKAPGPVWDLGRLS